MAGLHLSEPSDPLDVTHESSKIVKLALTGRSVDLPGFCLRILLGILDIVP